MFYLNSTLNFGIPLVLVFQLEDYCKVGRLLTGLTSQQKGIIDGIRIKHLYDLMQGQGLVYCFYLINLSITEFNIEC